MNDRLKLLAFLSRHKIPIHVAIAELEQAAKALLSKPKLREKAVRKPPETR